MKLRKLSCVSIALAAVAAGASPVNAQMTFYGGAALLGSKLEPKVNSSGFTVTESGSDGARIFAGADVSRRVSVEGYYSELGSAELTNQVINGEIDYQAAGISGLLYLYSNDSLEDRRGLLAYVRAGYGSLKNSASEGVNYTRVNDGHLSSGVGLEYVFNSGIGLRAEWMSHDADAQDASIGLVMRFGGKSSRPAQDQDDPVAQGTDVVDDEGTQTTQKLTPPPPPPPAPMPAATVDLALSEVDSDGDGVLDNADLCVDTATGVSVAANGCAFTGVLSGVNFASGSSELTQQATDLLANVIAELSANSQLKISVNSHTDNQGSAANNMALSRQRAVTVVRYLADVGGIDLSRMSAVGFGESQPLQSNKTAEGRAANRRVEITVSE